MPKRSKKKATKHRPAETREQAGAAKNATREFQKMCKKILKRKPQQIVELIRQGSDVANLAIGSHIGSDSLLLKRLVQAGLVDAILDWFENCRLGIAKETSKAFLKEGREISPLGAVNEALMKKTMSLLLIFFSEKCLPAPVLAEVCRAIVPRLKPFMKLMCDPEDLFFEMQTEWLIHLPALVALLYELAKSEEVVPLMMQQEEISKFLIQCLCARHCRPDIAQDLVTLETKGFCMENTMTEIEKLAAGALGNLLPEELGKLTRFANTPATFLRGIKQNEDVVPKTLANCLIDIIVVATEYHSESTLHSLCGILVILSFTGEAFPVLGVITKLVKLGASVKIRSSFQANLIVRSLSKILQFSRLGDDHFARAIQAGLFEMCLDVTVSFGTKDPGLADLVGILLRGAGSVALERKSNKAIRKRAPMIRAKIDECSKGGSTCSQVALEKVQLLQNILKTTDATKDATKELKGICTWCGIVLPLEATKRCSRCHETFYCSQDCQARDWKEGGHKQCCKRIAARMTFDKQNGPRSAQRLKENLMSVSIQLFHESITQIILQATTKGFPILDCVVELDFRKTPPTITVRLAGDHWEEVNSQETTRARNMLECTRETGSLILAGISQCGSGSVALYLTRSPPHGSKPFDVLQKDLSCGFFEKTGLGSAVE